MAILGRWRQDRLPQGPVRLPFPVWFSRHGETDWNKAGRYQGHTDIPLNETGRGQARRNGRVLKDIFKAPATLDYAVSPLSRTRETLELIRTEMGLPPQRYRVDDRLIEARLGVWEGRTSEEIVKDDPEGWAIRERDRWAYTPEGAETVEEIALRIRSFLLTLKGPTLVVGHGMSGRLLRGYLSRLDRPGTNALTSPQGVVWKLEKGREEAF